jgi:D-3-phosphoglycerate dehydrogenase / 2-oxoglutarate reductase
VPLEERLSQADIVSLHAPATADNHDMLDAAAFARMREGSFLINTVRESLVNEDALRRALASGHLAGAALDVAARPAADASHPLLELPNVLLTPLMRHCVAVPSWLRPQSAGWPRARFPITF